MCLAFSHAQGTAICINELCRKLCRLTSYTTLGIERNPRTTRVHTFEERHGLGKGGINNSIIIQTKNKDKILNKGL